jgi:hypothetical protein
VDSCKSFEKLKLFVRKMVFVDKAYKAYDKDYNSVFALAVSAVNANFTCTVVFYADI